jgi:hypothetical protein
VQAIVWTYKRRGQGADPPGLTPAVEEATRFAQRGHQLLDGLHRIPGHDPLGELKADRLTSWVNTVREACTELGRLEVADICIGTLFSRAPIGEDGTWPCEPVRQVLEAMHSNDMMEGAQIGRYNLRGMTWRGEGGDQERELAGKYRGWANALQYSHPLVASELLMSIAKSYKSDASREDMEAGIRRRLR